ncbi:alpha/beta hydrolase [Ideonella sp.]|uniref:alpha/beta hydrolase n=1 Tax=Ideonella sp. TaxID=1929293 RepID=UPI0035B2679D
MHIPLPSVRSVLSTALLAAAMSPVAWAYDVCIPPPPDEETSNIASPHPEGRVNNAAPTPMGVDLPEQGLLGATPVPAPDDRGVYTNIKWRSGDWLEPTRGCASTRFVFDVLPAKDYDPRATDGKVFPVIVYFHENGATHAWETGSPIDTNVATVARNGNFHFVSVEFRHPVADQYLADDPPHTVPHTDVGLFIQFLRKNAAKFKVDKRNIFAFGRSRGSLALWQGLQADMGSGDTSSKVNAFVGYEAQTSYQCQTFSDNFLIQDDAARAYVAECRSDAKNKYDPLFRNALDAVKPDTTLPVMLQYSDGFVEEPNGRVKLLAAHQLFSNYDHLHYPNFGLALYWRYFDLDLNKDRVRMAKPTTGVGKRAQFTGWLDFVNNWKVQ